MNAGLRRVIIDAHVHLHNARDAAEALRIAASRLAKVDGQTGVIMLAERQGFEVLDEIKPQLVATAEPEAFWHDESRKLLILAGRQVISAEKLEILALATTARLADGAPAEEIVAQLDALDAIVVLPWGVGKWLGKRGALVDLLIAAAKPGRLFLGDNGGRPSLWPVRQFGSGLPVLSGSDPLPLPGWPQGIGSLTSVIEAGLSPDTPAASLKAILRDPATHIGRGGSLAGPIQFVTDQTRLRLAGKEAIR
jgi:hypothetical protein